METHDDLTPEVKESREVRRDRLAREHPVRFTLQRVSVEVGEVVLGVLGVGAIIGVFVRGLLPDISWEWLPDVPQWIQNFEPPTWLRYIDPFYWIGRLDIPWPNVDLPGWLTDYANYWVPIVIALVVALGEVDRRRNKADEADDAQE